MINTKLYGPENDTPYVFVFDGTAEYGTLAEIFLPEDQKGSDGVVRWSGVALNTRKITLNLGRATGGVEWSAWTNILDIPLIPVSGVNHHTILSNPPAELVSLVLQALEVNSREDFSKFHDAAAKALVVMQAKDQLKTNLWQQFIVHAVDSHGNAITDYSIEIVSIDSDGARTTLTDFEANVHPYAAECRRQQLSLLPRAPQCTSTTPWQETDRSHPGVDRNRTGWVLGLRIECARAGYSRLRASRSRYLRLCRNSAR
jgi:hypothetical protein